MFSSNDKNKANNSQSKSSNIIQAQTTIKGFIETKGSLRIDGIVIGDINSNNKVVLGNQSKVEGNMVAQNVDIAGTVLGTLNIEEITVLRSTANISGDINTGNIIIESGAIFNGQCKMEKNQSNSSKKKAT